MGGGLGADGCTLWYLHLLGNLLVCSPIGSLPIGRSLREIGHKTGARSEDLDGDLFDVAHLALWDIHCLGNLELDSLGVIFFISFDWDINRETVGLTRRSGVHS